MEEISAASQERRKGIEQVNQAVTQMDGVTQQNAALVEEAAAAAQSMSSQSLRLKDMISVFRISSIRASMPDKSPEASTLTPRARMARGNVPVVRGRGKGACINDGWFVSTRIAVGLA